MNKLYRQIELTDEELDIYVFPHVSAMTGEKLHFKHEIAKELGVRDKRIKELEQAQPKWISVDDRLPTFGVDVLVFPIKMHLGDEPVYTANWGKSGDFEYIWCNSIYAVRGVTHWMPLPQPPEVK